MMAADYRHIGGPENRLGRHYSRFSAFQPAPLLAAQSLALRKSSNAGSNRRSRANRTLWRDRVGLFPPESPLANEAGIEVLSGPRDYDKVKRDLAAAHQNLGVALDKQGKSQKALVAFREAMRLNPDDGAIHNSLALVLATFPTRPRGDYEEALAHAKRAVELGPDKGNRHTSLAPAEYRLGHWTGSGDTIPNPGRITDACLESGILGSATRGRRYEVPYRSGSLSS